jgi:hypothetical protein
VLLGTAGVAAFIFLLLGGIQWITSAGDKDAVEKARKRITIAMSGLVIVFSAYIFMYVARALFNVNLIQVELAPIGTIGPPAPTFPPIPTSPPAPTSPPWPTATPYPTITPVITSAPTSTPHPSPSVSPSIWPTATGIPTPFPTPGPTLTPHPTPICSGVPPICVDCITCIEGYWVCIPCIPPI